MLFRICLSCICFLLTVKTTFAEIVNVNNQQIKELSKINIPIVDVRRSSEWDQNGIIPNSILLTFFDKKGNYNLDKWYNQLRLKINEGGPIILICRTGRRTKIIAEMMDKKFDNVMISSHAGETFASG